MLWHVLLEQVVWTSFIQNDKKAKYRYLSALTIWTIARANDNLL